MSASPLTAAGAESPEIRDLRESLERSLSLWKLYSDGKSAYVVGQFGKQGDAAAGGFKAACAAWPEWTGEGSGHAEAGPDAQPGDRAIPVIVPALDAVEAERDRYKALAGRLRELLGDWRITTALQAYHPLPIDLEHELACAMSDPDGQQAAAELAALRHQRDVLERTWARAATLGSVLPCGHSLHAFILVPPAGSACRLCMEALTPPATKTRKTTKGSPGVNRL